MSMDEDDDMFAESSSNVAPTNGEPKNLFRVLHVGGGKLANVPVQSGQDLLEAAAKKRMAKTDAVNHARSNLYDEKDQAEYDEDPDHLLDIADMGTEIEDAKAKSKGGKKQKSNEYKEFLEGEKIEPLSMKNELRRGEVNLYGEMKKRKKRKRGDDDEEEDPNELALPPEQGAAKKKRKQRRGRLSTGDSDSSEDDDSDGDAADDDEENEALDKDDPWLATIGRAGGFYDGSGSTTKNKPVDAEPTELYLRDTKEAMKELLAQLREGPAGETVVKLVKRLSPSSASARNKKPKLQETDTPSTHEQDNAAQESADQAAKAAKKALFDKFTSIASFLFDSGYTTIYEATLDTLTYKLQTLDDKNGGSRKTKSQANLDQAEHALEELAQGEDGTFWQYKWTKDAAEMFGPFDVPSMKSWAESFSQFPGMVVRGVKSPSDIAFLRPDQFWVPFEALLWT